MGSQTALLEKTGHKMKYILPLAVLTAKFALATYKQDVCEAIWESCVKGGQNSICNRNEDAVQIGWEQICQKGEACDAYLPSNMKRDKTFRKWCRTANKFRSSLCPPGGGSSGFNVDAIDGYACWCNFGQNLMKGGGPSQNPFDEACRGLQLCLRCAKYDGVVDGYGCDPKTDTYSAVGSSDFNQDCSANNQDTCSEHICSCNFHFLTSLLSFVFDNSIQYDSSFLHTNNWDPAANCPMQYGGDSEKACCGFYPFRFPYSLDSGKSCCYGDLYNPLSDVCCPDQSVTPIGVGCI